ncbi:MAG: 50S ribosomal protein L22 [Candidatus Vogelbacteria bacterium RIFOXYD1_FULL_44_32]|uniref:Large ribosomal subunit protein uL22 n=1 Tax=Candidatus Vogelbacteria bacterium RIFOXYD1_FULL_44_32 TaxID=1802438 RepID=A0A1G2QFG4_9BACT|nr:MAG: 50S ribosomal protein L22 [Candidatus Vogelbacteria bacterium RIFOXYD1_FULL_44_32]
MKASLSNYRQAPRKVRLLADLVRGKSVRSALIELGFADKRAAVPMKKLIDSAVANAENNFKAKLEDLFIKEIRVDKGVVMKRFLPRARGRATPLRHRTSHINVVLGVKAEVVKIAKAEKKTTAKVTKK